ncbi:anti-sigma factor [Halobacillus litoralis]|uniref:anti-sigma factor n=1 Tax=Halobacillus litoralis TaxID=45668 RepID=UPI001CD7D964|nr:anti-sigma factor [Halobacillus litoralis]MCA0971486.1 anti-sigma factor [Halobacillus litoralis]
MRECEKVLDYFNNELSNTEREKFEKHLESCDECREELEELRMLTDDLPFSSDPVEPPEGMKDRVLGAVFEEDKEVSEDQVVPLNEHRSKEEGPAHAPKPRGNRQRWMMSGLAAALAVSLIGNVYILSNGGEESVSEPPISESTDEVNSRVLLQGEATTASATAAIIRQNESQLLTLQAEQLDQLEGDQVYQVWLLAGDQPYRAGTFVANSNGEGAVAFSMDQLPADIDWEAVAVSKEPDAESQTPQGEVILSSTL